MKKINKILVVPDVHGRNFWRQVLKNTTDKIIFLGDYSDPYLPEGISHEDALCELEDIIQFKKDNPTRVILLLGNHDVHYLHRNFKSSRFSSEFFERYNNLYTFNRSLFQIAHGEDNFLFTHAGVTKEWATTYELQPGTANRIAVQLEEFFLLYPYTFRVISPSRGGTASTGSPIWADLHDHLDPWIPSLSQFFGHTQLMTTGNAIVKGKMHCLDSRTVFTIENGILTQNN